LPRHFLVQKRTDLVRIFEELREVNGRVLGDAS
jgi:hypothetical protein